MMRLSNTLMMNETLLPTGKKAFTLAEVLITLSILGVVAALTIPSLVNRQSDLAAQVKLKKAISNYEDVIGVYMAENETDNASGMIASDCTTTGKAITDYFKAVEVSKNTTTNRCDFTTADGTAWSLDPTTGNATVTDNKEAGAARYQVTMWNYNNRVNTNGTSDGVSNLDSTGAGTNVAIVPTNKIYGSSSLIDSTRSMVSAPEFLQGTYTCAKDKALALSKTGNVTAVTKDTVKCAE